MSQETISVEGKGIEGKKDFSEVVYDFCAVKTDWVVDFQKDKDKTFANILLKEAIEECITEEEYGENCETTRTALLNHHLQRWVTYIHGALRQPTLLESIEYLKQRIKPKSEDGSENLDKISQGIFTQLERRINNLPTELQEAVEAEGQIYKIPGDGRCGYHTLAAGLLPILQEDLLKGHRTRLDKLKSLSDPVAWEQFEKILPSLVTVPPPIPWLYFLVPLLQQLAVRNIENQIKAVTADSSFSESIQGLCKFKTEGKIDFHKDKNDKTFVSMILKEAIEESITSKKYPQNYKTTREQLLNVHLNHWTKFINQALRLPTLKEAIWYLKDNIEPDPIKNPLDNLSKEVLNQLIKEMEVIPDRWEKRRLAEIDVYKEIEALVEYYLGNVQFDPSNKIGVLDKSNNFGNDTESGKAAKAIAKLLKKEGLNTDSQKARALIKDHFFIAKEKGIECLALRVTKKYVLEKEVWPREADLSGAADQLDINFNMERQGKNTNLGKFKDPSNPRVTAYNTVTHWEVKLNPEYIQHKLVRNKAELEKKAAQLAPILPLEAPVMGLEVLTALEKALEKNPEARTLQELIDMVEEEEVVKPLQMLLQKLGKNVDIRLCQEGDKQESPEALAKKTACDSIYHACRKALIAVYGRYSRYFSETESLQNKLNFDCRDKLRTLEKLYGNYQQLLENPSTDAQALLKDFQERTAVLLAGFESRGVPDKKAIERAANTLSQIEQQLNDLPEMCWGRNVLIVYQNKAGNVEKMTSVDRRYPGTDTITATSHNGKGEAPNYVKVSTYEKSWDNRLKERTYKRFGSLAPYKGGNKHWGVSKARQNMLEIQGGKDNPFLYEHLITPTPFGKLLGGIVDKFLDRQAWQYEQNCIASFTIPNFYYRCDPVNSLRIFQTSDPNYSRVQGQRALTWIEMVKRLLPEGEKQKLSWKDYEEAYTLAREAAEKYAQVADEYAGMLDTCKLLEQELKELKALKRTLHKNEISTKLLEDIKKKENSLKVLKMNLAKLEPIADRQRSIVLTCIDTVHTQALALKNKLVPFVEVQSQKVSSSTLAYRLLLVSSVLEENYDPDYNLLKPALWSLIAKFAGVDFGSGCKSANDRLRAVAAAIEALSTTDQTKLRNYLDILYQHHTGQGKSFSSDELKYFNDLLKQIGENFDKDIASEEITRRDNSGAAKSSEDLFSSKPECSPRTIKQNKRASTYGAHKRKSKSPEASRYQHVRGLLTADLLKNLEKFPPAGRALLKKVIAAFRETIQIDENSFESLEKKIKAYATVDQMLDEAYKGTEGFWNKVSLFFGGTDKEIFRERIGQLKKLVSLQTEHLTQKKNNNSYNFWFSNLSQLVQMKISQQPENEKLKEFQAWIERVMDKEPSPSLEEQICAYWKGIMEENVVESLLDKPGEIVYQRLIKYDLSELPPALFEKILNNDNNIIINCDLEQQIPQEYMIEKKLMILNQWVKILDEIPQDNKYDKAAEFLVDVVQAHLQQTSHPKAAIKLLLTQLEEYSPAFMAVVFNKIPKEMRELLSAENYVGKMFEKTQGEKENLSRIHFMLTVVLIKNYPERKEELSDQEKGLIQNFFKDKTNKRYEAIFEEMLARNDKLKEGYCALYKKEAWFKALHDSENEPSQKNEIDLQQDIHQNDKGIKLQG